MPAALPADPARPGPQPHADGSTTFAVHTHPDIDRLEVCLLGNDGEQRHLLPDRHGSLWAGRIEGVTAGQQYGLRASSPAHREHASKLLVDPYARLLTLPPVPADLGPAGAPAGPLHLSDPRDSGPYVPRSVVSEQLLALPDTRPRVPWDQTVVYEAQVATLTANHPFVPEALRGTYAGVAHSAVVAHLVDLGVTAVELLPVQACWSEPHLARRGLANAWGYNTVGFFAPRPELAARPERAHEEFQAMVAALHRAGLEVWLDVVYNHTADGDADGPCLSLRGLDDSVYRRGPSGYDDVTGCGNTLDPRHPFTQRLVLDSLRYWVSELGVDGFRFDLAPALARTHDDGSFDPRSPLLTAIATDPVLAETKLVVEPWDVARDGYHVGGFPHPYAEWNGQYRDAVRDAWLTSRRHSTPPAVAALCERVSGSRAQFGAVGRQPWSSVNLLTAHDGFTLADLVSYNHKHNAANGEDNRDGTQDNRSWNAGVEGPTPDIDVLRTRRNLRRALLATLLLSVGTPMLLAGDELGRTQLGNNNAYAQTGALTWLDWSAGGDPRDPAGPDPLLLPLVRGLLRLRRDDPTLRRIGFLTGAEVDPGGLPDVVWFGADGRLLAADGWHAESTTLVGMWLSGQALPARNATGSRVLGGTWLLVLNPGNDAELRLPPPPYCVQPTLVLDTADDSLLGGLIEAPGSDAAAGARPASALPDRATPVGAEGVGAEPRGALPDPAAPASAAPIAPNAAGALPDPAAAASAAPIAPAVAGAGPSTLSAFVRVEASSVQLWRC